MLNRKRPHIIGTTSIIHKLYEGIPVEQRHAIMRGKKYAMLSKSSIRAQIYIPKELYAILEYFGAFEHGESSFFTGLAERFIEDKITKDQIMSLLSKT